MIINSSKRFSKFNFINKNGEWFGLCDELVNYINENIEDKYVEIVKKITENSFFFDEVLKNYTICFVVIFILF